MNRVGKFKTFLLVLVAVFSVGSFYNSIVASQAVTQVQSKIDSIPLEPKVVVYKSKDGYTPVKGIDYFDGVAGIAGANGSNGKDSVSSVTSTIQTIVKEIPIPGPKGDKGDSGKDSPTPQYRTDEYGNFQTKNDGDLFWQNLIECERFVGGCK